MNLGQAHLDLVGREPVSVHAAPGRVNLVGEHTDYNAGLCLPMALPQCSYAAVSPRADDWVTIIDAAMAEHGDANARFSARLSDLAPDRLHGWAAYAGGVVWAMREAGYQLPGMDLTFRSEVPRGGGLSSSAALECSIALAACAVAGYPLDDARRRELIGICMRAEQEAAGAPTGGMDQSVSLLATAGHATLIDASDWHTEQVRWPFAEDEAVVLITDTRVSHSLSDGQYGSRRQECEAAAAQLGVDSLRGVDPDASGRTSRALDALPDLLQRRARHVITENARVRAAVATMTAGDLVGLGEILSASHASLRDDFEVSCAELDLVVDSAMGVGAYGARMTGGGFGGSAIALLQPSQVAAAKAAISEGFERRGWREPAYLLGTPSPGARQL